MWGKAFREHVGVRRSDNWSDVFVTRVQSNPFQELINFFRMPTFINVGSLGSANKYTGMVNNAGITQVSQ